MASVVVGEVPQSVIVRCRHSDVDPAAPPATARASLFSTSVLVLVFAALAVGLGAVAFAASDQATRVGTDAIILRDTQDLLLESTVLRSNVGLTLVLASAVGEGLEVQETPEAAIAASLQSLDRLESTATDLSARGGPSVSMQVAALEQAMAATFDRLSDPAAADRLARQEFLPAVDRFDRTLTEELGEISARLDAESSTARTAAFASSLAVGLLVPALAVVFVRSSSRRKARRDLLAAELRAERSLSEARDDLISGLSHELRTPLTGIYGFAEALRDLAVAGEHDPRFADEAADAIYREAVDLRRMIDDLLVAARADTGALVYHFANVQVTDEVQAAAEAYVKRGDRIIVECEPAMVRTDRLRLQHAIRNVLDNAVRHGGPFVTVSGKAIGSSYRLVISDMGEGVPADIADRMFDRYIHRGLQSGMTGGVGMGLSVARTLMEGMGGVIEYRRVKDQTVFVFEIPMAISRGERPVAVT